jgi:hypothetical protein
MVLSLLFAAHGVSSPTLSSATLAGFVLAGKHAIAAGLKAGLEACKIPFGK